MSFLVGELVASVRADPRRFRQDMATVRREGAQSATQVNRSMDGVGRKLTQLGFLAKAAFSSAIVVGARQAVREFALLEGAVAKFNVVFADQADEMREWVDTVRERVPLATREIVQNTAALQDLLVPMGIARSEAMGMTQDWFELAAALSAFNDVPVEQALQAIQSGIAGQTRPLRQFGIDVRETALQQTALEEGLISSADAMDETARQQALLIQAYNQSQDAIDGYEDQLGSTLMMEQELNASFKDTVSVIGESLQPAYNSLLGTLNEILNVIQLLSAEDIQSFFGMARGIQDALVPLGSMTREMRDMISSARQTREEIEGIQDAIQGILDTSANDADFGQIAQTFSRISARLQEIEQRADFGQMRPGDPVLLEYQALNNQVEVLSVFLQEAENAQRSFNEEAESLTSILSNIKQRVDAIETVDNIIDIGDMDSLIGSFDELKSILGEDFDMSIEEFSKLNTEIRDLNDIMNEIESDGDFSHRLFPPGSTGAIRQEIANIENQLESATDEERIQRLNDRIRELQEELQRLGGLSGQTKEDLEEMSDASRLFTRTLADGLQQVLFQARSVSDALDGIIRQLGSRALTAGLATLISGGSIGFSTAFFGGFRASGGAVSQGRGYVVGESGPELFVPDSGGSIVSNEQMQGSERTLNINITGNLKGDGNEIRAIVQESIRIEARKR